MEIPHLIQVCRSASAIVAAQRDARHEADDCHGAACLALAAVLPRLPSIQSIDDYVYILATNAARTYLREQRRCWPPPGYDPARPGVKGIALDELLSRYEVEQPAYIDRQTEIELDRAQHEWREELHACCRDTTDRYIVQALANGATLIDVAAYLAVSPSTVMRRRDAIRRRLCERMDWRTFTPFLSNSMRVSGHEQTLNMGGNDE